jgi:hypothetical protein
MGLPNWNTCLPQSKIDVHPFMESWWRPLVDTAAVHGTDARSIMLRNHECASLSAERGSQLDAADECVQRAPSVQWVRQLSDYAVAPRWHMLSRHSSKMHETARG